MKSLFALQFTRLEAGICNFLLEPSPAPGDRLPKAIGKPSSNADQPLELPTSRVVLLVEDGSPRRDRAFLCWNTPSQFEACDAPRPEADSRDPKGNRPFVLRFQEACAPKLSALRTLAERQLSSNARPDDLSTAIELEEEP